jgi:guanylate kinase
MVWGRLRLQAEIEVTMTEGTLYVVSAPSGAGKTSLIKALLGREQQLHLSVSYTTRAPRPGEQDGVHYHFVDAGTFRRMVGEGAFVEHAEVFGNWYGTGEATLRASLARGDDLVLEIDWQGAHQVRQRFPQAVGIFILPPSVATLDTRLRGRGQDDAEIIAGRMAQARAEISHYGDYDYLVVNDDFATALDDLAAILRARRLLQTFQTPRLRSLLDALLGGGEQEA